MSEAKLMGYVENNGDISLAEIAENFKVSSATICKKLKRY
ncbi:MAG: DeoR family transcriptional regulator [Rickettsiales endosymbiont of Dermacentor nuttalli]